MVSKIKKRNLKLLEIFTDFWEAKRSQGNIKYR